MKEALNRILRKDIKNIEKKAINNLGIYIKFNESNMLSANAIIVGPKDSLYEGGLLLFSIDFPKNYPYVPPKLKYIKNNSVRIHPNFYVNGKVCLSILGTWAGPGWCSTMDISDIFITIISLLDLNPMSHEPGYENIINKSTKLYNKIIEYNTINSLLISQAKNIITNKDNEFYCFKDIIINHIVNNYDKFLEKIEILIDNNSDKEEYINVRLYNITIVINYRNLIVKLKQLKSLI